MNIERIDSIVESLIFLSGSGMDRVALCDALGIQKTELAKSVKRLGKKYGGDSGVHLLVFGDKLQFVSNPDNKDEVEAVLLPIKEKELSKSALETIAIVAYKQPITKLEIEQIRGVNCDYAITMLVKYGLVEIVGHKDSVGKPVLLGTTQEFLRHFGLNSINALPDYTTLIEELAKLQATMSGELKTTSDGLYNDFKLNDELLDSEQVQIIESE